MEALADLILMPFLMAAHLVLGRHADAESIFIFAIAEMITAFCIAAVLFGMLTAMWFS